MIISDWQNIFDGTDKINESGCACAVGGFDGTHRGHMLLLNNIVKQKALNGMTPAVITFKRPPRTINSSASYPGDISTLRMRLEIFESVGVERVILIDFSPEFGKLSGRTFIAALRESARMRYLTEGENFRCGYKLDVGAGELSVLAREYDFTFEKTEVLTEGGAAVSSSVIREHIKRGDLKKARLLLGRPFCLDIRSVPQTRRGESSAVFKRSDCVQTAPPDGTYAGAVKTSAGKEIPARLSLSSEDIRIDGKLDDSPIDKFVFADYNGL